MKILSVRHSNRSREFHVKTRRGVYAFPYSRLEAKPSRENPIVKVFVDRELGGEAFTYQLLSGAEATVHVDAVLDFNEDPAFLTEALLYKLTVEARRRVDQGAIGMRALSRRLGTSASQIYRLLDPTNYRKSVRQMLDLLHALDCRVEFIVRKRRA